MSHEADIHQVQTTILRQLLFVRNLNFASLQKSTALESDHFKFHLKRLVATGYICKTATGSYELTQTGKEYANRLDTDDNTLEKQPKLSVAVVVEDDQGRILAQQRLKHPFFGFWGRVTGKIRFGESFETAAARELLEETGLTADLRVAGFYHKTDFSKNTNRLLEDKLFVIVHAINPRGQLAVQLEGHKNEWLSEKQLLAKAKVFQSVPEISKMARSAGFDFIQHQYFYDDTDY